MKNFNDLKNKDSGRHRKEVRPLRPRMSPYARNVAILILLGAFLLITGIMYYGIQSYFWYQQGWKPIIQTGGQSSTQTPIELPPLKTTGLPATMTVTSPAAQPGTSGPSNTKEPPKPSLEPSHTPSSSPTPSASAETSSTPSATVSPTSATPGTITASPSPIKTQEPTITLTPTPRPTGTPTATGTPES